MNKQNKWVTLIVLLAFLAIVGYGIFQWLRFEYIDGFSSNRIIYFRRICRLYRDR